MSNGIDYELTEYVELDTPERLKAATDPVRALVLDLVLERAMSVTELAARIGKSKGTLAHHVEVLVTQGLLQVVRVRKVRAVEERFYGRVARTIVFPGHPKGELPFMSEAVAEADFEALNADAAPAAFTLRHARIPGERAEEWCTRLDALALEFSQERRGGDVEFALYLGLFPTNRPVAPVPTRRARPRRPKEAS
jgi:DNA-binding transcriptional ArsR family regulator